MSSILASDLMWSFAGTSLIHAKRRDLNPVSFLLTGATLWISKKVGGLAYLYFGLKNVKSVVQNPLTIKIEKFSPILSVFIYELASAKFSHLRVCGILTAASFAYHFFYSEIEPEEEIKRVFKNLSLFSSLSFLLECRREHPHLLSYLIKVINFYIIENATQTILENFNQNKKSESPDRPFQNKISYIPAMLLFAADLKYSHKSTLISVSGLIINISLVLINYGLAVKEVADLVRKNLRIKNLEILELKPTATVEEIKAAYKRLALKCHPDKNPDDPNAAESFQIIGEAYKQLTET